MTTTHGNCERCGEPIKYGDTQVLVHLYEKWRLREHHFFCLSCWKQIIIPVAPALEFSE